MRHLRSNTGKLLKRGLPRRHCASELALQQSRTGNQVLGLLLVVMHKRDDLLQLHVVGLRQVLWRQTASLNARASHQQLECLCVFEGTEQQKSGWSSST